METLTSLKPKTRELLLACKETGEMKDGDKDR